MQDAIDKILSKMGPPTTKKLDRTLDEDKEMSIKMRKMAARRLMSALKSDSEDDFLSAYDEFKETVI